MRRRVSDGEGPLVCLRKGVRGGGIPCLLGHSCMHGETGPPARTYIPYALNAVERTFYAPGHMIHIPGETSEQIDSAAWGVGPHRSVRVSARTDASLSLVRM